MAHSGPLNRLGLAPEAPGFLRRLITNVDLRALNIAEGVRAALSVAVLVAANQWLQWPAMNEAALGALLTCLCDSGGPVARRVPAVLTFGALGTLVVALIGLARGQGALLALPVGVAALFTFSFMRVFGQAWQQVGNLLTVAVVLALDHPFASLGTALPVAAAFLAGSLWAAALTLVIWRLHPFGPARAALAHAYRALARLSRDLRDLVRQDSVDEAAWVMHGREQRRAVREAIEAARIAVLAVARSRGPASNRAAQTLIRLETADQIFGALIGISALAEHDLPPDSRDSLRQILRRLPPVLTILARQIGHDLPNPSGRLDQALAAIVEAAAKLPREGSLARAVDALAERLTIAITMTTPAEMQGLSPAGPMPFAANWARAVTLVRGNLQWRSEALRHAIRAALAAAVALTITLIWYGPYEHWLTITLVVTMQPYFGLTLQRALERIGGTVAGGVLATVITLFCRTPITIAAALFPLAVIAMSIRQVSFGLFMAALTPLVVLLAELGQPGSSEIQIAALRAVFTLAGGLLAVLAVVFLWPSWEHAEGLAESLMISVVAHAAYAQALLGHAQGNSTAHAVELARREAGLASNNLEALLQRALLEPKPRSPVRIEAAMVVDAALRRLAGRLSALQLQPDLADACGRSVWHAWEAWTDASMRALVRGQRLDPRPAGIGGPVGESLDRVARQIELMQGAMDRFRSTA